MGTNISWTDETVNPIQGVRPNHWFCRHVSPGCDNCYADTFNRRLGGAPFGDPWFHNDSISSNLRLDMGQFKKLRRLPAGSKVFVCDMTDLFGEWVPDEWISHIFAFMELNTQLVFQVLTKRPQRMLDWCREHAPIGRNIWLGTTVESSDYVWRLNYLAETPAAVRFVSFEPLLGDLGDLSKWLWTVNRNFATMSSRALESGASEEAYPSAVIQWAIIGGESGPKRRLFDLAWARDIKRQCDDAGVAVWFKQTGGLRPGMGEDALGAVYHEFPTVTA
ncbi:MAG: DUF5131 family protein [Patescibacteria group bacterium]|nr:DUF5131 family protein [Patescibacteria group bacterium]